jgi:hypothetical protein
VWLVRCNIITIDQKYDDQLAANVTTVFECVKLAPEATLPVRLPDYVLHVLWHCTDTATAHCDTAFNSWHANMLQTITRWQTCRLAGE